MAPSMMRKMVEKPSVKNAPSGLSQKLNCSKRTWRTTIFTSSMPLNEPVVGAEALVLLVALEGVACQLQVDVLQGAPNNGQRHERVAVVEGPSREVVQDTHLV